MSPSLQPPKKDFFVSYTKTDRNWAEWIAWYLENEGYTCILQKWDFRPGGNFVLDMQEATQAERTIAVLSPDYLNATFPQSEWTAAFVQDPTSKDRKLIPVRVRECKPEGLLAAIGYIDLVGRDPQKALEALLQGIRPNRAKPTSAPAFPGGGAPSTPHSTSDSSTPPPFPGSPLASKPVETFIVYDREDETFRTELEKHLQPLEREGQVRLWHIGKLKAGDEIQPEVNKHLHKAKLFLLLVSVHFINSSDCQMLAEHAMQCHNANDARVVPILLSSCYWEGSSFSKLTMNPQSRGHAKPIDQWTNKNSVYLNIINEIRSILPKP